MTAARMPDHWASVVNHPVVDGLLALLVAGLALASLVGRVSQVRLTPAGSVRFHIADALGVVLLLLGALSLTWRRHAPLAVLGVTGAAFFVYQALGYAPPPLPFALLIALYTVAESRALSISVSATGVMVLGVVATAIVHQGPLTHDHFLAYLESIVAAGVLGYGVQLRCARMSWLEEQAVQLAGEQADRTRLAVEQEHKRIARELHDSVAHNVSVIVAQAGAAQRVFNAEPEQARQALRSIETSGREALIEMRQLLGVLQTDQAQAGRAPQPGLDRLPSLLAQVREAGLPVQLTIHGIQRRLPARLELSAYRIVQEALTNTLKHAGPTRAKVVLDYHTRFLKLQICDDGQAGTPNLIPGHGLVGMQQRATLLGGELAVGPGPHGGFQVMARLPVDGERL